MIDYKHAPIDDVILHGRGMLYRSALYHIDSAYYSWDRKIYTLSLCSHMIDDDIHLYFKKRKEWEKFIRDFVILQRDLSLRDDVKAFYLLSCTEYTDARYDPFDFILYSFWEKDVIMAFPDQKSACQYFTKIHRERLAFTKEYQYER